MKRRDFSPLLPPFRLLHAPGGKPHEAEDQLVVLGGHEGRKEREREGKRGRREKKEKAERKRGGEGEREKRTDGGKKGKTKMTKS